MWCAPVAFALRLPMASVMTDGIPIGDQYGNIVHSIEHVCYGAV